MAYTLQLPLFKDIVENWNFVFFDSVNVSLGETEERPMMTGLHTVADIFCVGCGSIVGWKYVRLWGSASNIIVFPSFM